MRWKHYLLEILFLLIFCGFCPDGPSMVSCTILLQKEREKGMKILLHHADVGKKKKTLFEELFTYALLAFS